MATQLLPRLGRAIRRIAAEHYGAYHVGLYRQQRNDYLVIARTTAYDDTRERYIRWAVTAHRSMMRCIRDIGRTM